MAQIKKSNFQCIYWGDQYKKYILCKPYTFFCLCITVFVISHFIFAHEIGEKMKKIKHLPLFSHPRKLINSQLSPFGRTQVVKALTEGNIPYFRAYNMPPNIICTLFLIYRMKRKRFFLSYGFIEQWQSLIFSWLTLFFLIRWWNRKRETKNS